MQALAYQGPGGKALEDRPKRIVQVPTDAVVRITRTTTCAPGTVLGYEGVGVVDAVGADATCP